MSSSSLYTDPKCNITYDPSANKSQVPSAVVDFVGFLLEQGVCVPYYEAGFVANTAKETKDSAVNVVKGVKDTVSTAINLLEIVVISVIGLIGLSIYNASGVGQGIRTAGEGIAAARS